jgi:hypothetical protein
MPVDIGSHPSYGPAAAKYRAERDQAVTAGDEVGKAQAELGWANAQAEMKADLYERQDQERGRQAQLARIKSENPNVPDSVFENIADLDVAEKVAKDFQQLAGSRPQQTPQQGGTWSPPPGGQAASDPEDFVDPNEVRDPKTSILPSIQRKMDKLSPTVMQKGALARAENQELQNASLEPLISRFRGNG